MNVIRIVDEVGINSLIENKAYADSLIVGPGVIVPLDHVTMTDCGFDGTPESIFIEIPENRFVQGVIGLRNTSFLRCRFQNIAIAGTPENVKNLRAELSRGARPLSPIQGNQAVVGQQALGLSVPEPA